MLNKKFFGLIATAVMSVSVMGLVGNLGYAEEETHKHSEKALASEHPIEEEFICPSCKEVRLSPEKGRTLAAMRMVCPDCKNEISELAVHHCDKCDKDVLVCTMCKKASAELKAATMEGKCPKCKEVRTRPIKGKTLAKWEMKCPDCKKKTQEWLIQHCDECGVDFLTCPICLKEQQKTKK
jgi:phage FluMu protein Com